jgi:hypothetical protein
MEWETLKRHQMTEIVNRAFEAIFISIRREKDTDPLIALILKNNVTINNIANDTNVIYL